MLDWANARAGPVEYDRARTATIPRGTERRTLADERIRQP